MARDLVSGGLFFVGVAFLAYLTSTFMPMWWVMSTELEGQQCLCATGLWQSNYTWGYDITEKHVHGGRIACESSEEYMVQGCDAEYDGQSETRTKGYIAGVFSLISVLATLVSFSFGYAALVHRHHSTCDLDVIAFRKGLVWASLSGLVSVFTEVTAIGIYMSSPLFENLADRFGCNFVFDHPLNSNPLKCGALGPSFGLAVGGCLVSVFSCIMFYLAFKNPNYIDPETGRYSMFQHVLLGQRPLDRMAEQSHHDNDHYETGYFRLGRNNEIVIDHQNQQQEQQSGNENDRNNINDDDDDGDRDDDGNVNVSNGSPFKLNCGHIACKMNRDGRMANNKNFSSLGQILRLYHVPILLILNAALFVWSNCSTGATVEPNVKITFPKAFDWIGHKLFPSYVDADGNVSFKDDVFNFTLFTSLRHFWNGQAYALAFLIGGMSGCWPYVKIFCMITLWFVPATETLRGKLLHWLDVLGKWSLVDAYVLCLMAVAFGFNTDQEVLGINIHVAIYVRPGWGVYSFVIGTMISLLMSHYLTYLHRHAMEAREIGPQVIKAMDRPPHEALADRSYAPYPRRRRFACSKFGRLAMLFVISTTLAITLTGQIIHSFRFEFSGLADLILPVEKRSTDYSLISLGTLLPDAASRGGFLSGGNWAWFITIMYFLFAMIIPLAMLACLGILFFVPMTLATTKRWFHICQFVQAWAALDVFLVSIIAAVVEIGGLSQAVLSNAFGSIEETVCDLLETLTHVLGKSFMDLIFKLIGLPPISGELEDCVLFRVDAFLLEGCWMLLFGVASWAICTHVIMEFADASIEERTMVLKAFDMDDDSDAQHDPYILLRTHSLSAMSPPTPGYNNADEDDDDDGSNNNNNNTQEQQLLTISSQVEASTSNLVQSVYMKRILKAQEEGARRFMGTYFGDCMFGPFPRPWWTMFAKFGLLYKVEWDKVGFDIHAALLMNRFADNEEYRIRNMSVDSASRRRRTETNSSGTNRNNNINVGDVPDWSPTSPFIQQT